MRVLVCDDSPVIRRLLRILLEKQGYDVEAVESGEEAFTQALQQRFGLIVSDVQMGQLSGVQLCRLLRRDPMTRAIPFVLLTASDDPRSRFWGRHAGADAYIAKESMNEDLMPAVERFGSSRPLRRADRNQDPCHPPGGSARPPLRSAGRTSV